MRTKALLIAAAAFAATVISTEAQVYSQNIVGYVNATVGSGFNNVATPLDISSGNSLTNVFPNPVNASTGYGPIDFTTVYVWNGAGYSVYTIDSYWSTGVGNSADNAQVTGPTLNPGTVYYFNNNTGTAFTNTVVGTVHVDGAGSSSNVVGVTTNTLGTGYQFVSSKLSIGGGLSSVLQLSNPVNPSTGYGPLDFTTVYIPNINASGVFLGYNVVTFDSYWTTGFGNSADNAQVAEPQIPVGQGFIFNNNTGAAVKWIQSL